jgi:hypothetical protein
MTVNLSVNSYASPTRSSVISAEATRADTHRGSPDDTPWLQHQGRQCEDSARTCRRRFSFPDRVLVLASSASSAGLNGYSGSVGIAWIARLAGAGPGGRGFRAADQLRISGCCYGFDVRPPRWASGSSELLGQHELAAGLALGDRLQRVARIGNG